MAMAASSLPPPEPQLGDAKSTEATLFRARKRSRPLRDYFKLPVKYVMRAAIRRM
jgi:hypothetical protein